MSWVAVAIGGAAVVSAGASAYSANKAGNASASASSEANAYNLRNAREQRAQELRLFEESRGASGYAVMPLFAKTASGEPLEPALYQEALATYNAALSAGESPQAALQRTKALIAQYSESQAAARGTVEGVYNGQLRRESLQDFNQVAQARTEGAMARKSAGLEAIEKTINETNAIQAKKGFSGDTFGNRLLRSNTRRQVFSDAATDMGRVNEENAADIFNIRQRDQDRRLSSLDLPYDMARRSVEFSTLPEDAAAAALARRIAIFEPFRLTERQAQLTPLPQVQPVVRPSALGTAASAFGAAAPAAAGMYMNYQLANRYATPPVNTTPPPTYQGSQALMARGYTPPPAYGPGY